MVCLSSGVAICLVAHGNVVFLIQLLWNQRGICLCVQVGGCCRGSQPCATHVGLHMFTNLSTSTKYTRSPNIRTVLNISVSVLTCVCCVATNLGGQLRLPSAVSCAPPASNSVSSVTMCLSTSIQTGVLLSVLPQNTTAHTALELQHS